ncbi:N-terminal nucleophile aminohydrolase [Trametes versicolor FP-101664 SS1]|uniref:N-terminal nucleophile aminohydrolase n=1 Tax=Trametes versicolor (strain FP-101664) TaxID=717944 RepID=UPI0004623249|nr:N-terminal nucleophile aminohydrolase [Trametes versicolor FP-101664 SS1]EIW63309.1 N-terminal nucleophile aminohydrolase [Trametes versicolor FP-101664 SS1]
MQGSPSAKDKPLRIVAVHGGAGFHPRSQSSDGEIKRALRLACARSLAALEREAALHAVTDAIAVLEDEECLNAGYGSNLTMSGIVECDASLMDGLTRDFGAIGAVSGVKNPIKLAHSVLQYSRTPDLLGRIPPLLLVSAGAQEFARTRDLACIPDSMISPRAHREWKRWTDALETARHAHPMDTMLETSSAVGLQHPQTDGLHDRQDTVGAIALDAEGNLAAGVSSGGLLLKLPGRVGEAAMYGAGCWATHRVSCSVSGAGEDITRASLAKTICSSVEAAGEDGDIHDVLQTVIGHQFHKVCAERGETSPQAGVILLVKEYDDDGQLRPRLWCAFTTESMAIGYASSVSSKPSVRPSLHPATAVLEAPRPSG